MQLEAVYGLDEGKPANFIILDSPNAFEAQRCRVEYLTSIRNGEYLFKKEPRVYETELYIDRK